MLKDTYICLIIGKGSWYLLRCSISYKNEPKYAKVISEL